MQVISIHKLKMFSQESSMELLKFWLFVLIISCFVSNISVLAQQDFLSYDCGFDGESYNDDKTKLPYTSDKDITDAGTTMDISSEFLTNNNNNLDRQFRFVRSFPDGDRSCYTLRATRGTNTSYLIRASFMYGNYDDANRFPVFDLHIGVNFWATVKISRVDEVVRWEVVFEPETERFDVCLVNNGSGTPFVSVLELRPLPESVVYKIGLFPFLVPFRRLNFGALATQNVIRYPDDFLDRIWVPPAPALVNNTNPIMSNILDGNLSNSDYQLPASVMRTAAEAKNNGTLLSFDWIPLISRCFVYIHLSEVDIKQGEIREFDIFLNNDPSPFEKKLYRPKSFSDSLFTDAFVGGDKISLRLNRTEQSTLPPTLNAIEIYMGLGMVESPTNRTDVDAMEGIKSAYVVKKNWQGDPCFPARYRWEGVECTSDGTRRITSMKLNSSGLDGPIDSSLSALTSLEYLDLSNNNLSGAVPDFLAEMQSLQFLNLTANKLSGTIPAALMERANSNKLQLYLDENLCLSGLCERKKKKKPVAAIVASTTSVLVLIVIALALFWWLKRKKIDGKSSEENRKVGTKNEDHSTLQSSSGITEPEETHMPFGSKNPIFVSGEEVLPLEYKNPHFTFSQVVSITDNFSRVIGKGGFGAVYYGRLSDKTQVAVKMLSASSLQGSKQFRAEARLLMTVHHKNLTSLIGYCDEGKNMVLIYEYMANGDLQKLLSDGNTNGLSWEERLRIAIDAAQGLEYMHSGIKPPVIHRDVKTANILLDEKFQAKIGDFGLSRMMAVESKNYVTASVAGTLGYLDPEYLETQQLNEKSDVYSFGVVLLEVITGQRAINKQREHPHIAQWVASMVSRGDIRNIIDPFLGADFDTNSVWKAVEIAMACVTFSSPKRPTMNHVLSELKKCLEMTRPDNRSDNSMEMLGINIESRLSLSPIAR